MQLTPEALYFCRQAEAYLVKHRDELTHHEAHAIGRVIGEVRRGERLVGEYVADVGRYVRGLA